MKRATLEALVAAKRDKRAAVLLTPLHEGAERDDRTSRVWTKDDPDIAPELRDAALRALATDDAFTVETASGPVFVQPMNPPLRLYVVGAVHIAEPLAKIAAMLGYDVTIVDPREAFARAERWPGVAVRAEWPDDVLGAAGIDHRTAVVALTHDPKIDDPALEAALASPAFYVGALGSGKTHASRLRRLAERGVPSEALARVHGPVGLRIGARTPGEIAVSIVAQMTEVLRRAPAERAAAGERSAPAERASSAGERSAATAERTVAASNEGLSAASNERASSAGGRSPAAS